MSSTHFYDRPLTVETINPELTEYQRHYNTTDHKTALVY